MPKPNGGVRKLEIPTVMDRVIQQGIVQVIRGWINDYAFGFMKTAMAEIDAYLRTRLRIII
ncbi:MAG: hypothetical protein IJV50_06410 [Lachnospiraceae bacterium]|nr:hypothetical protein [Lachnospiraceae bacterium]